MVLIKRYREIPTAGFAVTEGAVDAGGQREEEPLFVEDDEASAVSAGEVIPGVEDESYAGGAFNFPVIPRFTVEGRSYQFVFWNWTSTPANTAHTGVRLSESLHVRGEARADEDTITLWYERVSEDGRPIGGTPGVLVRGFSVADDKFFRKPPIASVDPANLWDGSAFVSTANSKVTITPRSDYLRINVLLLRMGYDFSGWLEPAPPRNPITGEPAFSPSFELSVAQGRSRRAIALYQPFGKQINALPDTLVKLLRGEKIDIATIQPPGPHERFDDHELGALFAGAVGDAPAPILRELHPKVQSMIGNLTAIERAIGKKITPGSQ